MHPIRPSNVTTAHAEPSEISLLQISPPTLAQQVAPQILSSLGPNPTTESQTLEISFSPKELGKLVLKVQAVEAGAQLVIQVDRPETLELMRRNVEDLAQKLKSAGFQNLSFGDPEARKRTATPPPEQSEATTEAPTEQDTEPPKLRQAGRPQSGRMLDLRV